MVTEAATDFTSPADLRAALMASAWLPLVVRGTADFRGRRALDGGVPTLHPYSSPWTTAAPTSCR